MRYHDMSTVNKERWRRAPKRRTVSTDDHIPPFIVIATEKMDAPTERIITIDNDDAVDVQYDVYIWHSNQYNLRRHRRLERQKEPWRRRQRRVSCWIMLQYCVLCWQQNAKCYWPAVNCFAIFANHHARIECSLAFPKLDAWLAVLLRAFLAGFLAIYDIEIVGMYIGR